MLIELLREAAGEVPDQPAVLGPAGSLTYAECLGRSEALARGLDGRSTDRFACVVDDVGTLLALLCASSAVGTEACVYPEDLDQSGIASYAETFGHAAVITDRALGLDGPAVVAVDALQSDDRPLPPPPARRPALILTTGTSGRPKAARHDWSRLVGSSARHSDERPGSRWLLAYNLHQFAGLQVLLHVLASRATLVVPASRRPRDAVDAIRDFGVTHASATPTFWRFVTGMLDQQGAGDLALRQITLGGEAVPASLLADLTRLFPAARISQVYAATEFGSSVSVRDGRAGLPVSLLDRGEDADVRLRIVDGELHVCSRIGMLGYLGESDAGDDWRPTGDLVEVRGDRICFVGRTSERINVGGVKVHPYPVEELVSSVSGVALVRAYGRPNPVTGQIVAVDVVARPDADRERVEKEIRTACESLPAAGRPRRIRFVDDLEVRGHKILRHS